MFEFKGDPVDVDVEYITSSLSMEQRTEGDNKGHDNQQNSQDVKPSITEVSDENNGTTIICECDSGLVDGTVVTSISEHSGQGMQDQHQNMSCGDSTEIRIKVDVDDGSGVEDHLAQLAHTNVTTASIITIPVVPYTVIGESDGVSFYID